MNKPSTFNRKRRANSQCAKGQTARSDRTIVRCMDSDKRARWQELCEQASKEQDPAKMLALTQEINRLLHDEEERRAGRKPATAA